MPKTIKTFQEFHEAHLPGRDGRDFLHLCISISKAEQMIREMQEQINAHDDGGPEYIGELYQTPVIKFTLFGHLAPQVTFPPLQPIKTPPRPLRTP